MSESKYSKVALSLGLLIGGVAPIGYESIGHAETQSDAMNILASLTKEQRSLTFLSPFAAYYFKW